jgi:hypothetical protein
MFRDTLTHRESTIVGGGNLAKASFKPSDIRKDKNLQTFSMITHAKEGSKTYNDHVLRRNPPNANRRSNKREPFVNPYVNYANFDRGLPRLPPQMNKQQVDRDQITEERKRMKEFRNTMKDSNIELDEMLGSMPDDSNNPFNNLLKTRQEVLKNLPANLPRGVRNNVLNAVNNAYINQVVGQQQAFNRNPATGAAINNPLTIAREQAQQNILGVHPNARLIQQAFQNAQVPRPHPYRAPNLRIGGQAQAMIFPDEQLFQNRNRVEGPVLRVTEEVQAQIMPYQNLTATRVNIMDLEELQRVARFFDLPHTEQTPRNALIQMIKSNLPAQAGAGGGPRRGRPAQNQIVRRR